MNYSDWYLDLKSLTDLPKEEKENIHNYYSQMLHCDNDNRKSMASSYFHTLQKGHIKNATQENRDEKIGELING
jgi:hypothetical protein